MTRNCPKCNDRLQFRTLVEDNEEKVYKNLYYCNRCKEHILEISQFSDYVKGNNKKNATHI